MNTENLLEKWATRVLSFATVSAMIYFVFFVDFSNHGRLWDKIATRIPVLAKIIPLAPDTTTRVIKVSPPAEPVSGADRTLIVADHSPDAVSRPMSNTAAPAPMPAAAKERLAPTPHLTSTLTPYNIHDNSGNTVISVPGTQMTSQTNKASGSSTSGQSGNTADTVATRASYGTASRSEMMGPAAGPVYNLKGKKK